MEEEAGSRHRVWAVVAGQQPVDTHCSNKHPTLSKAERRGTGAPNFGAEGHGIGEGHGMQDALPETFTVLLVSGCPVL